MAVKYDVSAEFADGGRGSHTVTESWKGLTAKKALEALRLSLDMYLDGDGRPAEPNREELARRLAPYGADDGFVDAECRRMSECWTVWRAAKDFLKSGKRPGLRASAGSTTVRVSRVRPI